MAVLGCLGDTAAPKPPRPVSFSMVPLFQSRAAFSVPFDKVRITLSRGTTVALDTTISFPLGVDSLVLSLSVPISGAAETLTLNLAMINAAGDTVFRGGPVPVTLTTTNAQATPLPITVRYSGVGANARSVRITTKSVLLFFRDSVTLTATALDSTGQPIPGTPIAWRSLDTTLARVPADTLGKVVAGIARGVARIEAMLPTNLADTAQVTVQPVPAALGVVSGGGQSGPVGSALAQPLVVRVKAADSLGVQGVVVNFAVASGGGSLSKLTDTTAATGNATTTWTLGSALGSQSVTATVASAPSLTATLSATGVVGAAKKLAFQVQPSNVAANVAIAPPIQVVAQDTFGNVAAGFSGNVTLAIGANPGSATLGGTVTVAVVAGVATFSNLTLNQQGTGYTLVASATGLASATSTAFNVGPAAANLLAFTTEPPASVAAGSAFGIVVTARDALGNTATTFNGNVTAAITAGTGKAGAVLRGLTTVTAGAGVATFAGLSVDSVGTGYTLTASATGLTSATSTAFSVAAGAAASLAFTTQPPASVAPQTAFGFTVTARDGAGNTATGFSGVVTVAIVTNPAGGTLSGTLTQNAVAGVATFSGVSIDNIGAGYTLSASALGVSTATSSAISILAPLNVNAWINPSGGNWSVASNWSKGTVPVASDTVAIKQSGTYTVNLDVNGTFARLDVGAPSGTQTLSVAANTLTAGNGAFATNTVLNLGGTGTITGAGTLTVAGAFNWTGGNLGTGGGTVRVLSGGTLSIAPTATVNFAQYTLEVAGTGTWTGTATVNGGQAILRVASGGTLDIQGDPSVSFNTYYAWAPTLNVVGTLNRTTSPNAAVIGGPLNDSGTVSVQSGTLRLTGGGTSTGAYQVTAGDTLDFDAGTHTLAVGSNVTGAGTVKFSGGTVNAAGGYGVSGLSLINGGTANFNGTAGPAGSLTVASGTLGGSGLLTVSGPMSWTGGNLGTGGGTVRVLSGGTLSIAPTATVNFAQYTLEVAGTGTWTGTAQVYGGQAILRVASGGTLDIQGDPSVSFNTYYAWAPTLNVVGTLNRTTSPNAAVIGGPLNDSGTVSVQSGTLRLAGGGSGNTAWTVSTGATLELASGTWTVGTNMASTFAGNLLVSAGSLILNGHPVTIGGSFATAGSGALQMTLAADSLDVTGNASFGGAAGTLSNGVIRVAGNFTQTGTANFAPGPNTSAQHVVLSGSAAQSLSFADATNAFFRRLVINKTGGGVTLSTNVRASFFRLQSGTAVAGATARLLADTVYGLSTTSSLSPLAVEITSVLGDSGGAGFSPDTTVFTGANQAISLNNTTFGNYAYKSIRVAQTSGTATFVSNLSMTKDLVISSGTLNTNGHTISVTGNFSTQSTGVLTMALAADSLRVTGNVTFAGGSSAPSAGVITAGGNFTQATSSTAFAPTGTHHTVLNGSGTQNVSFANPTTSFFRRLEVQAITHTVALQTNVQVTDSLTMFAGGGAATMNGAGTSQRLTIGGLLSMQLSTASPTLVPPVVELSVTPNIAGGSFSPDTTVFLGANDTIRTCSACGWKNVRVGGGTLVTTGTVYNGSLIMSGGMYTFPTCCTGTDSVKGFLRTEGTGTLQLNDGDGTYYLVVRDSAVFGGGDETGLLVNSYLRIGGNFVQRGLSTSFTAASGHYTSFTGSGPHTVTFASPGASASTFGSLEVENPGQSSGITLGSNIFIAGVIYDSTTNSSVTDSIFGNGLTVNANGLNLYGSRFVLNNAPLVTNSTNLITSGLTFRSMSPTITQWTMDFPSAGAASMSNVNFLSAPTSGMYFAALASASGVSVAVALPVTPSYAVLNGSTFYKTINGAFTTSVTWGGSTLTNR